MNLNPHSTWDLSFQKGRKLTEAYILIGALIAIYYYSRESAPDFKLNEFGDFLAGALSPVAFLWLIFGYFQNNHAISIQAEELNLQTEELRNSIEEMKAANETSQHQLTSIQRTEELNKRDLFFRYYEVHTKDMDAFAKAISKSICFYEFSEGIGKFYDGHFRPAMNDVNYMMLNVAKKILEGNADSELRSNTIVEPIIKETQAFMGAFLSIEDHAKELDDSGTLAKILHRSTYGDFNKACKKILEAASEINIDIG